MKRYISLFLILTLTVCMMTTPVSAAESSIGYVDLMQYGGILYDGELYEDFKFTPTEEGRGYFEFPVGLPFPPGNIELLIFTGADLTLYNNSIYQYELSQSTSIIYDPADRYKTYIGNIRGTLQEEDTFRIYFDYSLGTYTPEIRILSAKILPYGYEPILIPFDCSWYESFGHDYDSVFEVDSYSISHDAGSSSANNTFSTEFNLDVNPDYILGMDYVDITIFAQNLEFTSISANINGIVLPVEYVQSFMGEGVLGWNTSLGYSEFTAGVYRVVIRLDVSGLSTMYLGEWPRVTIGYTANTFHTVDPVFAVDYVMVGKYWVQPDPDVSWLSKISITLEKWFPQLFSWVRSIDLHLTSYFSSLDMWLTEQTSDIVTAIKGDPADGEELDEASDQISQDVADIGQFEADQQAVLDNNFAVIQDTVSVTGFASALAFVQNYTNLIFVGMGDYFIVISVPLFLGLFFYICSRIPGVTRWRSRPPKDGAST